MLSVISAWDPALAGFNPAAHSRLLVIAPHPDDEMLAAAGLMQRVQSLGGIVHVVYLTDGEGYPAGVKAEEGRADPTASAYRDYGRLRQHEARDALHVLKVEAATFLGFPNNGLSRLMTAYWSDRRDPYLSPYTRRDRPRSGELVIRSTEFHGEDLSRELAKVIATFGPTMILVPRREDQHVDHCAAPYFLFDALSTVRHTKPALHPDVLFYIVHFNDWPFENDAPRLPRPIGLGARSSWFDFDLTAAESARKRTAISKYESQIKVMDWFLFGFARRNEWFAKRSATYPGLPLRHDPCSQFAEPLSPARQ